eukprot:GHVS01055842.1.p1 GENE.GHVS01055842.1~~GHVS01055842.1.p1  ORF type:complete len:254 (-),score=42.55 GHVS01055842.1:413-1174(-)
MYTAYYGPGQHYAAASPQQPYAQQPFSFPPTSSPPSSYPPPHAPGGMPEDSQVGYPMQQSYPSHMLAGAGPCAADMDGGFGASDVPFDVPNFRSLAGGIIAGLMAMICISLFICLARADFNLVFYLMGYYVWCIESDVTDYEGVHKLLRSVHHFTMALCLACLIDVTWLFMAFSTWLCASGTAAVCFDQPEDSKLRWTYGIHSMVLFLSTVNLFIKVAVILMSFAWTQKQRKGGGSAPPSPVRAPPHALPVNS